MVIEIEGGKQIFLIDDPGKIVIKTGGERSVYSRRAVRNNRRSCEWNTRRRMSRGSRAS